MLVRCGPCSSITSTHMAVQPTLMMMPRGDRCERTSRALTLTCPHLQDVSLPSVELSPGLLAAAAASWQAAASRASASHQLPQDIQLEVCATYAAPAYGGGSGGNGGGRMVLTLRADSTTNEASGEFALRRESGRCTDPALRISDQVEPGACSSRCNLAQQLPEPAWPRNSPQPFIPSQQPLSSV